MKNLNLKTQKIDNCNWYHKTDKDLAKNILKEGFVIQSGGKHRFTEGVYLSPHSKSAYGNATLNVCITGNFLEVKGLPHRDWSVMKMHYNKKIEGKGKIPNYTRLTKEIQKDFPNVDGLLLTERGKNIMSVVWKPEKIYDITLL